MNQKHMDSISPGIHMGLKNQGGGGRMHLGKSILGLTKLPAFVNSSLRFVMIVSWAGFLPNNRMYRMSCSSLTNVSREKYPNPALPLSLFHGPRKLHSGLPDPLALGLMTQQGPFVFFHRDEALQGPSQIPQVSACQGPGSCQGRQQELLLSKVLRVTPDL